MTNLKAIVFDCFGLFYEDPVFAYMRDPTSPKDKAEALHDLDEQAARGLLSKAGFVAQVSELLNLSPEQTEDRFFHSQTRNDQLFGYIRILREQYKIALLSNIGSDMMDNYFTTSERKELFDAFILSGDEGITKPSHAIFSLVCERLGILPNGAIMIDDMQTNVDAAKQIGMGGICYKQFDQFQAELTAILVRQPESELSA